jgi:hypothetical protein
LIPAASSSPRPFKAVYKLYRRADPPKNHEANTNELEPYRRQPPRLGGFKKHKKAVADVE